MSGSILQAAIADARKIVTKGGFEVYVTISTPSGDMTLETTGIGKKHFTDVNTDGIPITTKNASISVHEHDLAEKDYPVRNANQDINLRGHKISFKDSSGIVKDYIVRDTIPSETIGLITLILGDWQS